MLSVTADFFCDCCMSNTVSCDYYVSFFSSWPLNDLFFSDTVENDHSEESSADMDTGAMLYAKHAEFPEAEEGSSPDHVGLTPHLETSERYEGTHF